MFTPSSWKSKLMFLSLNFSDFPHNEIWVMLIQLYFHRSDAKLFSVHPSRRHMMSLSLLVMLTLLVLITWLRRGLPDFFLMKLLFYLLWLVFCREILSDCVTILLLFKVSSTSKARSKMGKLTSRP